MLMGDIKLCQDKNNGPFFTGIKDPNVRNIGLIQMYSCNLFWGRCLELQ